MTFFQGTRTQLTLGVEESMFDIQSNEAYYSTFIYTDSMEASDTLIVRTYVDDPVSSTYKLYLEETIAGVQSKPVFFIAPMPSRNYKVTTTQTTQGGGGLKSFNWRRVET